MSSHPRRPRLIRRRCVALTLGALLAAGGAWACKYSVRDVAFSVLEAADYRLEVVVAPAEAQQRVREAVIALGIDANLELIFNDDATASTEESESDDAIEIRGELVAPDDRRLPVDVSWTAGDEATLWEFVESLVDSPLRTQAAEALLKSHSVILVVAGSDARAADDARRFAESAATSVEATLPTLPKAIDSPPATLLVDAETAARESVFLWSLGWDPADERDAGLIMLYGRLRRLGEVLYVPGAAAGDLAATLSVVGQDCECGLDRYWMQGPLSLHRWPAELEEQAVAALGFDPGSPLVRSEMVRILARGPRAGESGESSFTASSDPLLGYEEIDLSVIPIGTNPKKVEPSDVERVLSDEPAEVATAPADSTIPPIAAAAPAPSPAPRPATPAEAFEKYWSAPRWGLVVFGAFGVLVVVWLVAVLLPRRES